MFLVVVAVVVLYFPVSSFDEIWGVSITFAIVYMIFHSVCFLSGFSGRECIRERQYLYAAVLCSIGWFDVWRMVVPVVVGFLYILISRCVFLVIWRSRKFIVLLISWVGLNLMSLYI